MNPLREKMKNKKNLSIFVTYYIGKKIHRNTSCWPWWFLLWKVGRMINDVKGDF